MSKLIVVTGATGRLGGSILRRMLKEGWAVRAITRNPNSEAARALPETVEVVTADYDDEESLAKAFDGATAVFGVTNFFDFVAQLGDAHAAGQKEFEQMLRLALAANKTDSLEHFILHSLPSGEKLTGSRERVVPHWDYKDRAADEIKRRMPDLAAKTTFLLAGYFTSNFWTFPFTTPFELPNSYGGYAMIWPVSENTVMWMTDVDHNVGSFVNAILKQPSISLPAKYVMVATETMPMKEALAVWSEVTGRRGNFLTVDGEKFDSLWGVWGREFRAMVEVNEQESDWCKAHTAVLGPKELGIRADDLLSFRQSLEANREKL